MPTRRQVVKGGVAAGAAAAIAGPQLLTRTAQAATIPGASIPKYQTNLHIIPAMPKVTSVAGRDTFHYVARRFSQQVLPAGFPATTVQGFGHPNGSLNRFPGPTLEARANVPSQVTWTNGLMASNGNFLPQLFPVDPTIHWSNPPGGVNGRDTMPTFTETPGPYTGPHTLIVHHHGAHDFQESDGYPESWYLPNANNIPSGFAKVGSFYDQFKAEAAARWGVNWPAGALISVYPNDQRAMTLWFHDHSLGTTRLGPHSGLIGFSILRGGSSDLPAGVLPGPAPKAGDPAGTKYREIMLALTNHTYNEDGSVFFPGQRNLINGTPHPGPFVPFSDVAPIWNPTRVGDVNEVNGNSWPKFTVEARRYRFRFLAAANILPWRLKVVGAPADTAAITPIWVIGSDGGFLPAPVSTPVADPAFPGGRGLEIFTSERYDTIVDFAGLAGRSVFLINEFGAAGTTREVMRFDVTPATSNDTTTPPSQLTSLPGFVNVGTPTNVRAMSLNQINTTDPRFPNEPSHFQLGTCNTDGSNNVLRDWSDPVTETPRLNTVDEWQFHNNTAGNHAIHVHLIEFQVISKLNRATGAEMRLPWEVGDKDTVVTPPNSITRIKGKYDRKVRMVWHCHLVDHEDHAMMRPMQVI